jgi:hypothetical protein
MFQLTIFDDLDRADSLMVDLSIIEISVVNPDSHPDPDLHGSTSFW